ncbi:MAG TPA: hypothetical protein VJ984_01625 [Xanthomonadales bacterium]|nr:hypothetical protein [Xanthomonadales bacterium]
MNDFIFALLDTTERFADREAAKQARGWSIGFTRFKYDGRIIESANRDELLQMAVSTGARHCLLLSYGSFVSEVWVPHQSDNGRPDHEDTTDGNILDSLFRWTERHGLAVAGKFSESGSSLPELLFIDLQQFPKQGVPTFDAVRVEALENTLPAHIANQIISFNPSAQNSDFLAQLDTLTARLRKAVFVWNIESYEDIESPAPGFTAPLTSLYTVAAGFKPNRILETHGFHRKTRMVIFDYSLKGLEHRRLMHQEWNGEDYPRFLRQRFGNADRDDIHYLLWHGATPENPDWSLMEKRWQQELDAWGGESAFTDHWQRFRELDIEYVHCDLLQAPEKILECVKHEPGSLIWWSNAFLTLDSIRRYTTSQRKVIYRNWIESLAQKAPLLHLYGSDCNNLSVNGFTAQEYSGWLTEDGDDPLDELTPKGLNRIKMRY